MTQDQWRCSVESSSRNEPLYATASLVSAWLLIEQPGAWGPDALIESKFPASIARELERRSGRVRVLLIRHRSTRRGDPVFFKAHSGGNGVGPSLVSASLSDPALLLDVDFDALAEGDVGPGQEIDRPIYLVCTHGRHDVCCADRGRPLYRALSPIRPERTWEVSHLGGDRFAGNLLVLPRGDYFGRVEPDEVETLVSNYESGRIDISHHRGRSSQPRLVQAAEFFLREAEGITGFDDLVVTDYHRLDHDHADVVFRREEDVVAVSVRARRVDEPRSLTCRADQAAYPVSYDLVSITRTR